MEASSQLIAVAQGLSIGSKIVRVQSFDRAVYVVIKKDLDLRIVRICKHSRSLSQVQLGTGTIAAASQIDIFE